MNIITLFCDIDDFFLEYQLLEKKPTLNLAELQGVSDLPVIF